jgi:TonB family protein
MDADKTAPTYQLKSELARFCLPSAKRDGNLKLAWTNSICILFLLIGIVGARRGFIAVKSAPPLEEAVPVVAQWVSLPPEPVAEKSPLVELRNLYPAPVAIVIPQMPNISFSVPAIGSLAIPSKLATAPPLEPFRPKTQIASIGGTGVGGERPAPPYPESAQQAGEQGTIVLLLTGNEAGDVISVEIKSSSGFSFLDRTAADFIKAHWRLPAGGGVFQTSITYELRF